MYKNQGISALPAVKTRMQYSTFFSHVITDPARRRSSMIEALTSGKIGMFSRLNAICT
jgi:hypothetical protein